ncbi:MAG: DUF3084 domain-containing protein [Candidatus Eremiobacteraeota bacterium]|nr:DUF3084 domain-containing protein [Candidatus Eremiobacteraeota bacterium]MBV8353858.1 DUF3084 domain-containing protein [Candidatus Eremiobacteraeota bacterium]
MQFLRGLSIIVVIMLFAGAIAYVGDRVGHQVGRRRLTLFGLRPKYTSTVVAVGTGMLIAFLVTVVALASSQDVQTAFFTLGTLDARIRDLQAQSDALENKTRNGQLVIEKGTPLQRQYIVLQPSESREEQLKKLSAYFNATFEIANQVYTQYPFNLRPSPYRANDPQIARKLREQLDDPNIQRNLRTNNPILMLAVFPENLYRGDQVTFAFASWQDRFIFGRDQVVAALDYLGGTIPDLSRLITLGQIEAIRAGMPAPFAQFPQIVPAGSVQRVDQSVARGKGVYRVTLLAAAETYTHNGTAGMTFHLNVAKVGSAKPGSAGSAAPRAR